MASESIEEKTLGIPHILELILENSEIIKKTKKQLDILYNCHPSYSRKKLKRDLEYLHVLEIERLNYDSDRAIANARCQNPTIFSGSRYVLTDSKKVSVFKQREVPEIAKRLYPTYIFLKRKMRGFLDQEKSLKLSLAQAKSSNASLEGGGLF